MALPSPNNIKSEVQAQQVLTDFRDYLTAPGWKIMDVKKFWMSLCHAYVDELDEGISIPEYRHQLLQDIRVAANSCVPSCNLPGIESPIFDAMYAKSCKVSRGKQTVLIQSPDEFVDAMKSLLQEVSSSGVPDFQNMFGFTKDFVKSIRNGSILNYVDLTLGMAILTSKAHDSQKATALQTKSLFTLQDCVALLVQDDVISKLGPLNFALVLNIVITESPSLEYYKAISKRLKDVLEDDWLTLEYATSPGMTVSQLMERANQKGIQDPVSELKGFEKRLKLCSDASSLRKWARDVAGFMVRQRKYSGVQIHII